ncbi:P-loop containing nucleoside triphosphate hydrolase protein [Trametes gibbosa]|nr:P-loop containing nucleoside triphosphate hydrolase protein [Trametes gibbosa]
MNNRGRSLRRLLGSSRALPAETRRITPEKKQPTTNGTIAVSGPESTHLTDIKHVDHVYNAQSNAWEYLDTKSDVLAEMVTPFGSAVRSGEWRNYCFAVVRKFPMIQTPGKVITFRIVIISTHLLQACKKVMGSVEGVSWTSDPLELSPEMLLTFLPRLERYERKLRDNSASEDDTSTTTAIHTLAKYLRKEYANTLAQISNLTEHGEITFALLYAILIPSTVIITRCSTTGETRALELLSAAKEYSPRGEYYNLHCRGVEGASSADDGDEEGSQEKPAPAFGMDESWVSVQAFKGTRKINTLAAFPLEYHPDPQAIRERLVRRGRKWAVLNGVRHVAYRGLATGDTGVKYSVNSRIMIDRGNFERINPNIGIPSPSVANVPCEQPASDGYTNMDEGVIPKVQVPRDDMLLLASPVLYGFSLSDKLWLRFNVEKISPIEWNKETFEGLVLPTDRKTLLRSLVEAHDSGSGFDDFVRGKGQGLVSNLFGPPGVGKTLSAEATSEHIRRPLYVVSSGDLGTGPSGLDTTLGKVFDVATCWNAIVLIDESSGHQNLERNAMVAVFLRHIEYYRGILFLTTNRITTFDEAFLSRIHVALHYTDLDVATKVQIWRAFLRKAGVADGKLSDELVMRLAKREVNGRQIKNACSTASSLARSRGVELGYEHLMEAIDTMEEFLSRFAAMRG